MHIYIHMHKVMYSQRHINPYFHTIPQDYLKKTITFFKSFNLMLRMEQRKL